MLYWFTDTMRREAIAQQEEELAEFGQIIFINDPMARAAGCPCHGPEEKAGRSNDPDGRRARHSTSSLANKLRVNPNYVRLAVSCGGSSSRGTSTPHAGVERRGRGTAQ